MFFSIIITAKSDFVNQVLYLKRTRLQARKVKDGKTTAGACLDCSGTELYLKIL